MVRGEGIYFWDAGRQALHRHELAADVRQHRPRRPARHRRDQAPGRGAGLRGAGDGHGGARARRQDARRSHARRSQSFLLHPRRRRSERERHPHRAHGHRAAEDHGPLSLAITAPPPARSRSPAIRGAGPTSPASRASSASSIRTNTAATFTAKATATRCSLRAASTRSRRSCYEGPRHHRRDLHRDGDRHERPHRPARRLPAGPARDLRPSRHPPRLRRSDVRPRHARAAGSPPITGTSSPT